MTATPAPALTAAEQEVVARFGIFEPEEREAALVETVARAIVAHRINGGTPHGSLCRCGEVTLDHDLHIAAAAIAAYRATQDGGAEKALRRRAAERAWADGYEACYRGEQRYRNPYRAALATQAGEGAR